MFGNPLLLADEGYQISRSVRLRSSASASFTRTMSASGTTDTWSIWCKRGKLGATQALFDYSNASTTSFGIEFTSGDALTFYDYSSAFRMNLVTTQVFRDPSAWYHIVCVLDTTQATTSNRAKIYVNGQQVTSFSTATYPTQNASLNIASSLAFGLGVTGGFTSQYLDGYLTEINFIDGQALTPSSFGETDVLTGVWKPKKYAGTYGTNGFFLNFSDNSSNTATTIGKDYSGNGNNWTPNNISVTAGVTYDSMLDVPTLWADGGNGRGNYAVLNPLDKNAGTTPSNANLTWTASTPWRPARATFGMTTGKWYWEVTASGANCMVGIGTATAAIGDNNYPGKDANGWGYFDSNGNKFNNGSGSAYGASYTTNDVIGVAFDADNGTLTFYKNNASQGTAFTGLTSGPYFPMIGNEGSTSHHNFGQRPFAYTPPTGFKALNTLNLPTPTILKGNAYFDATTYTGAGTTQSITNSGLMQPDFVWLKSRSNAGDSHYLYDALRGVNLSLTSNDTSAEQNIAQTLTSFNSNGFTLGTVGGAINGSGRTFVAWQWKEGATQGFDIVTYTGNGTAGRTISHSLGVSPAMTIVKDRSNGTNGWPVWHRAYAGTQTLYLESTTGLLTRDRVTAVSSTTFTVGSHTEVNNNGNTYVAYLFSEVAGFSRFGSYTGNGSADGPFCFTGFRPRWVMIKRTDASNNWNMLDAARDLYNPEGTVLYADQSNAEATDANLKADFLSNGFKLRGTWAGLNASGGTYIYAAFSETAFKFSLGR